MIQSCFVVGTDTGVGKTTVTTQLIKEAVNLEYRVAGMKPVASGAMIKDGDLWHSDVAAIQEAINVDLAVVDICPYLLNDPIAPSIAAQRQGITIDLEVIAQAFERVCLQSDVCFVEAAGGVRVPLDAEGSVDMLSIATKLKLPVILVVGIRLGAINHALLTIESIRKEGLSFIGWIANRIEPDTQNDQADVIEFLTTKIPAPLLKEYPYSPRSTDH